MFSVRRQTFSESTSPDYFEDGYCAPTRLLEPAESAHILALSRRADPEPTDWLKGWAVSCRAVFEVASRPRILDLLRPVLGDNIVLWGASVVERDPGQTHPWHVDIESSAPNGRFASLWIGLENTGPGSSPSDLAITPVRQNHTRSSREARVRSRRGVQRDGFVLVTRVRPPCSSCAGANSRWRGNLVRRADLALLE